MRKYLGAILVFSLLLFGSPLTIGASKNVEDAETASSRTITVYDVRLKIRHTELGLYNRTQEIDRSVLNGKAQKL